MRERRTPAIFTLLLGLVGLIAALDGPVTGQPSATSVAPGGYWMADASGGIHAFGNAPRFAAIDPPGTDTIVALAPLPTGDGLWLLDSGGRVHVRGDADHHGDGATASLATGERFTSMSATPSGAGYWLFTDRGRALAFGDAPDVTDLVEMGLALDGPVIDSVATPTGQGTYLLGGDGGIFALGDAAFRGSVRGALAGALPDQPAVAIVPTPGNDGYWVIAADGGVFAFSAPFRGSVPGVLPGQTLNAPVNGGVAYVDGYLLVADDGGIFNFSSADFAGSLGADPPSSPVIGVAAHTPGPAGGPPPTTPTPTPPVPGSRWAFEATFDGDPASPSQHLLPRSFDYSVTHRTHPPDHLPPRPTETPHHGPHRAGPNPAVAPLPQHPVRTSHRSNGTNPDPSFFICKHHMMSSMGEVEGYSVTSFWPRQEFDFAGGGTLEFDVNINEGHRRQWWEVMIVPRDHLRVGSAKEWLPIDETYPTERIVFDFSESRRRIGVGTGAIDPDGWLVSEADWRDLRFVFGDDPALDDRRVRRTMRITLGDRRIDWAIEGPDGTFDSYGVDVPGGLPFTRGLVLVKTHAYTPTKDGNVDTYTFHWDNLRFDGPVVGRYDAHEADDVIELSANGNRPIGDRDAATITLPSGPLANPVLFGQVHNPMRGQVLVSINGGPQQVVHPPEYTDGDCRSSGWKSFRLPLDARQLRPGTNDVVFEVGPHAACAGDNWDGFSVKDLEIQTDER